jgi:hypothetical protein
MTMCFIDGCERPGEFNPVLLLRVHTEHSPARAKLEITVCTCCAKRVTVRDLIDDQAWEALDSMFLAVGRMPATRALTEIEWLPIHDD